MGLKVNDIIEFEVKINILIQEDMKNQEGLVVQDYKREYTVSCLINGVYVNEYTLDADEYMIPPEDDVICLIKDEMKNNYKEVLEYEIFDVYKQEYESQSAKVRIMSLKE